MDVEDGWFTNGKPPPEAPPEPPPEAPKLVARHVCWDVTVFGAPDDRSAIFAAIRGICGPGDQKLCFSVALESGSTEFYVVDKDMINAALRGEEDKK